MHRILRFTQWTRLQNLIRKITSFWPASKIKTKCILDLFQIWPPCQILEIFVSLLTILKKRGIISSIGNKITATHILFFQNDFRVNIPRVGQWDLGNPRKLFLIDGLFCGIFQNYEWYQDVAQTLDTPKVNYLLNSLFIGL